MLHENFHNVLKVLKSLARDMPIGSYSEMWGKFSNSVFLGPTLHPCTDKVKFGMKEFSMPNFTPPHQCSVLHLQGKKPQTVPTNLHTAACASCNVASNNEI